MSSLTLSQKQYKLTLLNPKIRWETRAEALDLMTKISLPILAKLLRSRGTPEKLKFQIAKRLEKEKSRLKHGTPAEQETPEAAAPSLEAPFGFLNDTERQRLYDHALPGEKEMRALLWGDEDIQTEDVLYAACQRIHDGRLDPKDLNLRGNTAEKIEARWDEISLWRETVHKMDKGN